MNEVKMLAKYSFGLYVDFRNVPESQWLALMNQGYSPALDIYYANHEGNKTMVITEGFSIYRFGIMPYVF